MRQGVNVSFVHINSLSVLIFITPNLQWFNDVAIPRVFRSAARFARL